MGEVYRARDTRLDRVVAVKVLPAHAASQPQLRERFDREARAISQLAHPNICTLFDVGHESGIDYLVMEHLEGKTLAEVLRRGALALDQVLRYGAQIAGALAEAHRHGIVHRDLKPGNIMITRSGAKVLDFGLAKYIGAADAVSMDATNAERTEQRPLTEHGTIVGTLQYMSPEQLEAREADTRSDIFAFGSIAYEMATGRRAFDGDSRGAVMTAILEREPAPMSSLQPLTPQALDSLIRRCLAKSPDERFQNAGDLRFALDEIASQSESRPRTPTVYPTTRKRLWIAAATLGAVVAVAIAGWITRQRGPEESALAVRRTIAVLPFADLGIDPAHDYLRIAIADEITTILSADRSLVVRPFSVSRRFAADVDPRKAANELEVAGIVSGNLRTDGERLHVSLEVIDAAANRLFWREAFETSSADLLTMRRDLSARLRDDLLPQLASGANHQQPAVRAGDSSKPANLQAYTLYLRASAISTDPLPNEEALKLLEDAVRLDSGYGPAWAALSKRAYYSYRYHTGGEAAFARAHVAANRALQIDPDLVEAAANLINLRTEGGDTRQAWQEATKLVRRRPGSASAHMALATVLRYGGALEESARECEIAWSIDRHRGLRSCSLTLIMLGRYDRAEDFLRLDTGSVYSDRVRAAILLRRGDRSGALALMNPRSRALFDAAQGRDEREVKRRIAALRESFSQVHDGEPFYFFGVQIAFLGRDAEVLDMLDEAVRQNFCGYPAIDTEPLLASLRRHPRWSAYRARAMACHQAFMDGTRGN